MSYYLEVFHDGNYYAAPAIEVDEVGNKAYHCADKRHTGQKSQDKAGGYGKQNITNDGDQQSLYGSSLCAQRKKAVQITHAPIIYYMLICYRFLHNMSIKQAGIAPALNIT